MDPDAYLDELAEDLAARGVRLGNTFGKRALMRADGKAFACLLRGDLAFKLGRESAAHARALALEGSELFDPSGKGKPFKDWVLVRFAFADQWGAYAERALDT